MAAQRWVDGQLLTPAAMNELTCGGVLRFADAAARDAALTGGLAPTPGMTVYLASTSQAFTYLNVAGVAGWYPQPETLCFSARQTATQSLAATTYVTIAGFTLVNGRNYGSWLDPATGRFQPTLPGLYEFAGGLSMTGAPAAVSAHRGGFRLNGAPGSTYIPASEHRQITPSNVPVSFALRRFIIAMNGTTDYAELIAYASAATSTGTGAQAPVFSAKYLGQ